MRHDALLPEEQLALVVTALYDDAEARGWDTLPPADRTRAYGEWVEDDRIGGIVTRYMAPEAARTWIKEGPMKEYSRAMRGTGRYARFGRQGGTTPAEIVSYALGADAAIVDDSVGDKPSHCRARIASDEETYVVWGDAGNFRNLLWAALRASVRGGQPAHIVVMEPPGRTTSADVGAEHKAFTDRCGIGLHHMRERLGSRRPGATP